MMNASCFKRLLTGLIVISFTLLFVGNSACAQASQKQSLPKDLTSQEVSVGLVGAYLGGIFGYAFFTPIVQWIVGWYCPQSLDLEPSPGCELTPLMGTALGSSLGSSLFVISLGKRLSIEGNSLSAFAGATLGSLFGLIIADALNVTPWWMVGTIIIVGTPGGIMAALGYNVGARIKMKTMSFSNQRLELASITVSW